LSAARLKNSSRKVKASLIFILAEYVILTVQSTWRPVSANAEKRPLAVCDYRSIDVDDIIPTQRVYPHRTNEFYFLHYNPAQHWYSISVQTSEEGIMMLMYDTHPEDGARCKEILEPNCFLG
jgi:hypothetical protein